MSELEQTRDRRGVVTVKLNRPQVGNRLSGALIAALTDVARDLAQDASARVIVLTGVGADFCAGGDPVWMQAQIDGDAASRRTAAFGLATLLQTLNTLPKPLIGRINGSAIGGGVGLMSVCDVAVGVEDANFGLTETRIGLIPATIGPYVVGRIGATFARRYLLASRPFDARVAMEMGLLATVVPESQLDAAVEAEVSLWLDCAPGAVAEAKSLIHRLSGVPDEGLIAETIERLVRRWESAEAVEGVAALQQGRKPSWAG